MELNDVINSGFVFVAGFFYILNLYKLYVDKDVKGILINIFGGMMRCNDIAQGLVNASKEVGLDKPLVVRLEGTNVEMGMDILNNSGFPIKPVATMEEAAQKVVEMVKE